LAKRVLERAVDVAPGRGDCHALLSHLYSTDYWAAFDQRPDALDRAMAAARRAVDVAPSNNLSQWALALALFLRRESPAFRIAAQRAIELNPMDGSVCTFMGHLIAYSGEWERGLAIAGRASALNPNHAGWHGLPLFLDAYRQREYEQALEASLRLNMGGHFHEVSVFRRKGPRLFKTLPP
jgi:tetratricopeptide (TPR) repeat protein